MISVLGGLFYTTAKDDNNCLDQMLMIIFTKNLQAFISEIFASSYLLYKIVNVNVICTIRMAFAGLVGIFD